MSQYSDDLNTSFSNITAKEFKQWLLSDGYFTSTDMLPGIVKPSNLEKIKLKKINWDKPEKIPRTSPIKILGQKPNKGLREFSIIHPYIFLKLVDELVDDKSWEDIKTKLSTRSNVNVYSLPRINEDDTMRDLYGNSNSWQYFHTIDPIKYYISHNIEIITDIQNFYNTIYTHAIPWALMGKEKAKSNTQDYSLLGNRLDKLLQNACDGQSNGIPTGCAASDLISEIVLKDIDEKVSRTIKVTRSHAFRFRDDYRILCKDHRKANIVLNKLSDVLSEYGLQLNHEKTRTNQIEGHDQNHYKKYLAKTILEKCPAEDRIKFEAKEMFYYLRDTLDAQSYAQDKHYFDQSLKKIIQKLKNKTLIINCDSIWTEASIYLLLHAINSCKSVSTWGYGIIDHMLKVYATARNDRVKEIISDIIQCNVNSSNLLKTLWVYMILLNVDKDEANSYLAQSNFKIVKMIFNKQAPNIRFFDVRDRIKRSDLKELDKFILIEDKLLNRITKKQETIISSMKKK